MTGMGRMLVVIALITAGHVSFAARVEFSGSENKAVLESKIVPSRTSSVSSVSLELTIPAIEINKDSAGFDFLQVNALSPFPVVGNPEVLGTGSLLVVPNGHEPQLELVQVEEQQLENVRIRPAQQEWRCGGPKGSFSFNSALYSSNAVYPQSWASLQEVGNMAGVRLVRVAINPIRMDMANQKLLVASKLHLNVHFRQVSRSVNALTVPKSILETLQAGTANGKSLTSLVRVSGRPERMMIFTADSLKETLQPYINWKKSRGLEVEVVTLTQAGGDKDKLKEYIQKAYDAASVKPTYFLFVGNKDSLPAFKESTGSGSAASDYRMTLLAGDDAIPDVFYGRFLADSEEELKTQIQRTMDYEKSAGGQPWNRQGSTIASDEGSNPSDEEYAGQVQEALKAGTYQSVDSFFQGEKTATSQNILGALKEGRSWISYFGHGSGTSWGSVNDKFSTSTITEVDNQGRLPIIIDVACLNASWMNISKCFGKAWMTENGNGNAKGAVAYYGGSVSISWHPPAVMSVGIAKRHFENSLRTIGSSVMAGQLYLVEQMGDGYQVTDNMKWYNLFGDPSLVVKTN